MAEGMTEIKEYTFVYQGYSITLIDTPDYQDTHLGDFEMLTQLSTWLAVRNRYQKDLDGIIHI